jgi:NADPH2:quinone reductase
MSQTTMKAVVLDRFGEPGVLRLDEVERPRPDGGEVLVRVHVTGTNPVDAKIRQAGQWAQIELPAVIGYDASGAVEQVGPGVTDFAVGDEVWLTPEIFGNRHGSYAELLVAPVRIVGRKPAALSHEQAAAVPLAGGTAWEAVVRRLEVRAGETVLIHAGAGGVGSFAVQFAKVLGARVLATAGPSGRETLRELGADVALDYRSDDVYAAAAAENGGAGVDAVLDLVGGDTVARSADVTRPFGRLATILGAQGDLTASYLKNHTLSGVFLTRERQRLDEMAPLFERGQVAPLLDDVRPLADIAAVHERLDSGHGRGKVVLRVADG